jgi:poly(A) polymerase
MPASDNLPSLDLSSLDLPSLAGEPWLSSPATQRVLAAIEAGGHQARAVGGVVRNGLMGLPITDIDIATTALPQDVMQLARAVDLGVAETGLQHGTVTVIADHHPFEVTTLRRDVESHGRHATVAFTDDWAEDARRRDFTMNALYCDREGRVHDPLGGYADLLARRVRFIGEATDRIREDYLRILRFFRFTAQYGVGDPDPEGLVACTQLREGLAQLSKERIHQEMTRLLTAPRAVKAIEAMQTHGILAAVLPAAPRPAVFSRLTEIESAHGWKPDAMLRLAALCVVIDEDAGRIGRALKVSREERGVLDLGAREAARMTAVPSERSARAMLYALGPAGYRRSLALSLACALDCSTQEPAWSDALSLPARWTAPKLPVNGADVLARGVTAGPAIGDALRRVEAWWIAQDFVPERDALLAKLAEE